MHSVNNRIARKKFEICLNSTMKTTERRRSGVFICVNLFLTFSSVSIFDFKQVNAYWKLAMPQKT